MSWCTSQRIVGVAGLLGREVLLDELVHLLAVHGYFPGCRGVIGRAG
jgi:hypothetical protein